jgi:hypothetical protein
MSIKEIRVKSKIESDDEYPFSSFSEEEKEEEILFFQIKKKKRCKNMSFKKTKSNKTYTYTMKSYIDS